MRILVINPALIRLRSLGACEQDRLANLDRLRALGHDVRLLTGWMPYQQAADVKAFFSQRRLEVTLVPIGQQRFHPQRFGGVGLLDGMAWEYAAPALSNAVDNLLQDWKPDLVWCHGSYTWGPARVAKRHRIPVIIRSVNYEAEQLRQEGGDTLLNRLRYRAKAAGERQAVRLASVLAAITPDEQSIYASLGGSAQVRLLPLQTLSKLLRPAREARGSRPLRVFFMGASYNIHHNAAALRFLINEVVPRVRAAAPGEFEFHFLGSKVPADMQAQAAADVIFDGYVEDLEAHLNRMDIALAPSLSGVGMQQKVFEPLCRAFPTITHRRALAGYPLEDGKHVLVGQDADDFASHLLALRSAELRMHLSGEAAAQCERLFGEAELNARVGDVLNAAVATRDHATR